MSRNHNIEKSVLRSKIDKEKTLKECFIDGCGKKAINAHSIQKSGALSLLESNCNGNNCIYSFRETELNQKKENTFKPTGKKSASTFWGFCNDHDTDIFQEIENNPNRIDLNKLKHKFLLCFRAFAISYHRRKEDVHLFSKAEKNNDLKTHIKEYGDLDDKGFEEYLKGSKLAVSDMNPQKNLLIESLKNKDYDCLHYFHYTVEYQIKFTSTMLTSPPYLFSGKEINISMDHNYEYSDIISTFIPLKNKSLVVLASFKDRPDGIKYLNELSTFEKSKKEIALSWHALTDCENVFLSPHWYNSLSKENQNLILNLYLDSKDLNKPYLKFDSEKFKLNLFEKSKYPS